VFTNRKLLKGFLCELCFINQCTIDNRQLSFFYFKEIQCNSLDPENVSQLSLFALTIRMVISTLENPDSLSLDLIIPEMRALHFSNVCYRLCYFGIRIRSLQIKLYDMNLITIMTPIVGYNAN